MHPSSLPLDAPGLLLRTHTVEAPELLNDADVLSIVVVSVRRAALALPEHCTAMRLARHLVITPGVFDCRRPPLAP